MDFRAVPVVVLPLLFVGIIWVREYGYFREMSGITDGETKTLKFRLSDQPSITGVNCSISYQGEMVIIRGDLCRLSGLDRSKVGDTMVVVGAYQQRWFVADAVEVTSTPRKWLQKITDVRNRLLRLYRQAMPEPQASLVAGIVVGAQSELPHDLKTSLIKTGTMHIVAASGYNVAVVVGLALSVTVTLIGRRKGIGVTGLVLIGYLFLAGASPPVIRAGLMGLIMLLSVYFGRAYWALWGLVVVGGLMLVWQPWLLRSVSFQLSMAATAGVILGTKQKPNQETDSIWIVVRNELVQAFGITLAATIMTAPISIMAFGRTSWLGLVVNPLVLWLVPPLMYLGGLMALLGLLWFPCALLLSWIVTPMASVLVGLISLCSRVMVREIIVPLNWWSIFGWWMLWVGIWSIKSKAPMTKFK